MKRAVILAAVLIAAASLSAQNRTVTSDRILKAAAEPQNWLTYSGNYNGSATRPSTRSRPAT